MTSRQKPGMNAIYNDKLKQIEDAHVKWQSNQKKEKITRLKGVGQ